MTSHLEYLIAEYLEWQGYLIRRNTKVGWRTRGGWEMELNVVGFHPQSKQLVHYEPSLDIPRPTSSHCQTNCRNQHNMSCHVSDDGRLETLLPIEISCY